jgi:hypothetical protein
VLRMTKTDNLVRIEAFFAAMAKPRTAGAGICSALI